MDESVWDELCVNPQKQALESGREEGREAGLATGFCEGESVGIVKGVEYGMEVGFMRGVFREISETLSTNATAFADSLHLERIQKTATALSAMLDDFPSPDQIFNEKVPSIFHMPSDSEVGHDNDSEQEPDSTSSDVTRRMQAIRSKFKLLTVQLRWNIFSLKTVMDTAKIVLSGKEMTLGPASQTTDW